MLEALLINPPPHQVQRRTSHRGSLGASRLLQERFAARSHAQVRRLHPQGVRPGPRNNGTAIPAIRRSSWRSSGSTRPPARRRRTIWRGTSWRSAGTRRGRTASTTTTGRRSGGATRRGSGRTRTRRAGPTGTRRPTGPSWSRAAWRATRCGASTCSRPWPTCCVWTWTAGPGSSRRRRCAAGAGRRGLEGGGTSAVGQHGGQEDVSDRRHRRHQAVGGLRHRLFPPSGGPTRAAATPRRARPSA